MISNSDIIIGIYFSLYETSLGFGGVVANNQGLIRVLTPFSNLTRHEMNKKIAEMYPAAQSANTITAKAATLLSCYFKGETVEFDISLDFTGLTSFQRAVYEVVRQISSGQTKCYSQVAVEAGRERAARGVGMAMARNPFPIIIPCHRVVGKSGALVGFSAPGGVGSKHRLLLLERRNT